ncbi:MAG: phosphoribosyltransferase family protein [Deltaproteobacteria bacterium]|nr:phosphoribosyltransferase family protein [Deltaproteobacteria bacterium]
MSQDRSSQDRGQPPPGALPAGGRLEIRVAWADCPPGSLFALASRQNPRRGFLFVSKVLGKHWPARPSAMARAHRALAGKLHALRLDGPLVFIALAETAIGLGRAVFEEFCARPGGPAALFTQTTRYSLGRKAVLGLDEAHSHARGHLVHEPADPGDRETFYGARTLVLVDDEISTGRTLAGLARAFLGLCPTLGAVALVSLTDWLDGERAGDLASGLPVGVSFVSLLKGSFEFFPDGRERAAETFRSEGDWRDKSPFLARDHGRLGLRAGRGLPGLQAALAGLGLDRGRPVRVIGTGEFLHEPFLLALALEERGFDVLFQSTTRTPAMVGGAIGNRLRFADNYHDGIDNFLYNHAGAGAAQNVIVYETRPLPADHDLPRLLGARTVFL